MDFRREKKTNAILSFFGVYVLLSSSGMARLFLGDNWRLVYSSDIMKENKVGMRRVLKE